MSELAQARRIVEALSPYVSEARQARIRQVLNHRSRSVTLVLEDVVNDHNGAAVLRTADAMGLMEVHVVPNEAGFKASRKVAQGSQKWLDAVRHRSLGSCYDALRTRGFEIWASAVHGDAVPLPEVPSDRPVAFVFGNEHDGVSEYGLENADRLFHVPMFGFVESLNVSVAAALTLAHATDRRRQLGTWAPLTPEERIEFEARWFTRSVRAAAPLLARAGLEPLDESASFIELLEDGHP